MKHNILTLYRNKNQIFEYNTSLLNRLFSSTLWQITVASFAAFIIGYMLSRWSQSWVDRQAESYVYVSESRNVTELLSSYQKIYDALPNRAKPPVAIFLNANEPLKNTLNFMRSQQNDTMTQGAAEVFASFVDQWPNDYYILGGRTKVLFKAVSMKTCREITPESSSFVGNMGDFILHTNASTLNHPFCYIHQWSGSTPQPLLRYEIANGQTPLAVIVLPETLQTKFGIMSSWDIEQKSVIQH